MFKRHHTKYQFLKAFSSSLPNIKLSNCVRSKFCLNPKLLNFRTREPGIIEDASYGFQSKIDKIDLLFLTNMLKLFKQREEETKEQQQPKCQELFDNFRSKTHLTVS